MYYYYKKMSLNLADLKNLFFVDSPVKQAEIIAKHLKDICFFTTGEHLYMLTEQISYEIICGMMQIQNKLLTIVGKLVIDSYDALTDAEKTELKSIKRWTSVFSNSHVKLYYPQLICALTKKQMIDDYYDVVHFRNGFYDLKNGEFNQRVIGEHFITYFIDYDYKAPSKKQLAEISTIVRKIFPLNEDYLCICSILGSALTGRSTNDQTMLFLLGLASSGKSLTLSITELAIQKYFCQLKDDLFACGTTTCDKVFNTFADAPYIRIAWINEMKDKKCDSSVLKQFNDGRLQTVKLYKDGAESFQHRSKLIATSNTLPNLIIDSGVARRVVAYKTEAKFVDTIEEVDESKQIYLKNKDLQNEIVKKNLHIAWFQILADAAQEWLETQTIEYTENFTNTKSEIIDSNDIIKDFVDGNLIFTNLDKDRISKQEMLNTFKNFYPDKHLSVLQLISALKEKKVPYSSKYRMNGIQGCFYCVKLVESDEDREFYDEEGNFEGVDTSDKSVDLSVAYTNLLAKYNALLKQVNGNKKVKKFGIVHAEDLTDDVEKKPTKKKGFGQINKDDYDEVVVTTTTKKFIKC